MRIRLLLLFALVFIRFLRVERFNGHFICVSCASFFCLNMDDGMAYAGLIDGWMDMIGVGFGLVELLFFFCLREVL